METRQDYPSSPLAAQMWSLDTQYRDAIVTLAEAVVYPAAPIHPRPTTLSALWRAATGRIPQPRPPLRRSLGGPVRSL